MTDTYTQHAEVCAKFYELTLEAGAVADFVCDKVRPVSRQQALFVGGMFDVAQGLINRGFELTAVDYTDEMVAIGKERLPNARVMKADLRALPFESEFDFIVVVGRVFTHMIDNSDLAAAIRSCKQSLKPGGRLFADNYETSRIQVTNYFNGEVKCQDENTHIIRRSTTERLSSDPFVVRWDAEYSGCYREKDFFFSDSMEHRAFCRSEFADFLTTEGFEIIEQGDNFDDTSFYTVGLNAPRT